MAEPHGYCNLNITHVDLQQVRSKSHMANSNKTQKINGAGASVVRDEDLEEMESLLRDLQAKVDQAHNDGRVYLMSQYVRLVALISPEIDRVHRRFKREHLDYIRKMHKDLKLEQKAANDTGE